MIEIPSFPPDAERGVGLALQTEDGRYLFFLAGSRHARAAGECFFAGIGGHLEPDETPLECGRREAMEEIGARIEYVSHPGEIAYLAADRSFRIVEVDEAESVRPLAFFEMVHPPGSPRAGGVYYITIYNARLLSEPGELKRDEVAGLLALNREQLVRSLDRRLTLRELTASGAELLSEGETKWDPETRLYPLGTAEALALLLQLQEPRVDWHGTAPIDDGELLYSVVFARYKGQLLLVRNHRESVWELPGGKREPGETMEQAAARELQEETGAAEFDLHPVGVYALNGSCGMLYTAEVRRLGELPESEIAEIRLVEELPANLRYGRVYEELSQKLRGQPPIKNEKAFKPPQSWV